MPNDFNQQIEANNQLQPNEEFLADPKHQREPSSESEEEEEAPLPKKLNWDRATKLFKCWDRGANYKKSNWNKSVLFSTYAQLMALSPSDRNNRLEGEYKLLKTNVAKLLGVATVRINEDSLFFHLRRNGHRCRGELPNNSAKKDSLKNPEKVRKIFEEEVERDLMLSVAKLKSVAKRRHGTNQQNATSSSSTKSVVEEAEDDVEQHLAKPKEVERDLMLSVAKLISVAKRRHGTNQQNATSSRSTEPMLAEAEDDVEQNLSKPKKSRKQNTMVEAQSNMEKDVEAVQPQVVATSPHSGSPMPQHVATSHCLSPIPHHFEAALGCVKAISQHLIATPSFCVPPIETSSLDISRPTSLFVASSSSIATTSQDIALIQLSSNDLNPSSCSSIMKSEPIMDATSTGTTPTMAFSESATGSSSVQQEYDLNAAVDRKPVLNSIQTLPFPSWSGDQFRLSDIRPELESIVAKWRLTIKQEGENFLFIPPTGSRALTAGVLLGLTEHKRNITYNEFHGMKLDKEKCDQFPMSFGLIEFMLNFQAKCAQLFDEPTPAEYEVIKLEETEESG